jgi:toxin-antitoxin system PIN domain toxin
VILIDTNVLVYATIPGFPEHGQAMKLLARLDRDKLPHAVTWINVFEYLRVVTHRAMIKPHPLPLAKALENVRQLLEHPRVTRIDPGTHHLEIFEEICREAGPVEGNFVHDCRIAAVMRENGVQRILTRDTAFRRIPGITVEDPFQ